MEGLTSTVHNKTEQCGGGGAGEVGGHGKDSAVLSFRPVVLKPECPSPSPRRLVKPQIAGPTRRVSDSVGLGG